MRSSSESLLGRTALVTGASRGIGRAIALALGRDGADVAVHYRTDAHLAAECVSELRSLGRRSSAHRADVANREELRRLVGEVEREFGDIDILVNNAGVDFRGAGVVETEPDEVDRALRINALAPHELCRLVLPGMRRAERGDIVMLSSVVTEVMGADYAPYAMSKAALEALAVVLAKEERAHGIHVNVVAPGLVQTKMGDRYIEHLGADSDLEAVARMMPFGRICQPEEVAEVVRFLVSEGGAYVSGQRIYVNGGGQ
ncbi:SDR family oxidoreductase [Myxococcota bacterium]|nr:SDR family oxidoreductase [Myxococcota bacterium]